MQLATHTRQRARPGQHSVVPWISLVKTLATSTAHRLSTGGVVLAPEEGKRIAAALGNKGRVTILRNHGLLTTGGTVDEAAYLFTLMERSCEIQLMVESAGLPKKFVGDKEAEFTAQVNADAVSSLFS